MQLTHFSVTVGNSTVVAYVVLSYFRREVRYTVYHSRETYASDKHIRYNAGYPSAGAKLQPRLWGKSPLEKFSPIANFRLQLASHIFTHLPPRIKIILPWKTSRPLQYLNCLAVRAWGDGGYDGLSNNLRNRLHRRFTCSISQWDRYFNANPKFQRDSHAVEFPFQTHLIVYNPYNVTYCHLTQFTVWFKNFIVNRTVVPYIYFVGPCSQVGCNMPVIPDRIQNLAATKAGTILPSRSKNSFPCTQKFSKITRKIWPRIIIPLYSLDVFLP